jgi:hypothetical protein
MPGMNFVLDKGFQVQSAITQFTFVKMGTADQTVTAVTGVNDKVLGIALESASAGDVTKGRIINVRLLGIGRVQAAAALVRGVNVRTNATGQAAAVSGAAGTVDLVAGILMYSSAATGDLVDVLLTPGASVNTAVS